MREATPGSGQSWEGHKIETPSHLSTPTEKGGGEETNRPCRSCAGSGCAVPCTEARPQWRLAHRIDRGHRTSRTCWGYGRYEFKAVR